MVAIILGILAAVCFLLAVFGVSVGIDLVSLGLLFFVVAFVASLLPARYNR